MIRRGAGQGVETVVANVLECPNCGSRNVININLSMEAGERVAFYSCHRCEKRWWHKNGQDVTLPSVLDMASRRKTKRA
jgi:transposase-like protein